MSICVRLVTRSEEFAALEPDWRRLSDAGHDSIFTGWEWNSLWWKHYGDLGELHVLVATSGGKTVGIAPLYKTRTRVARIKAIDTLRFIGRGGDTSPDDLSFLVDVSIESAVLTALLEPLLSNAFPARLQLDDIPEVSALWPMLTAQLATSDAVVKHSIQKRYTATLPASWEAYRLQISRNTHKQIKRRENRLSREGNIEFVLCSNVDELEQMRKALEKLHHARWQEKGQGGSFASNRYRQFHRDLMHALLARKELFLLGMLINDEIAAVEYAFYAKGTLALFQTGFDPQLQRLSPGHALMTHAIRLAIEHGAKQLDLLKGEYQYKTSYANEVCTTHCVDIHKSGLGRTLARVRLLFDR